MRRKLCVEDSSWFALYRLLFDDGGLLPIEFDQIAPAIASSPG
jgi:hypothetical protein